MIRLRRPSAADIAAQLARDDPFSYPEVGATAELGAPLPRELAGTYDLDLCERALGSGRDVFARAVEALAQWRHFEVPWVELRGAAAPAHAGQTVATLVRLAGVWFLNPCRVVYARLDAPSEDLAAFAYGTLDGHAECGEERFVVRYDEASSQVRYEIAAFSRPAAFLSRIGYPFARRVQRRFAEASADALARAIAPGGGA